MTTVASARLETLLSAYAADMCRHHGVPGGVLVVVGRDDTRLTLPFGVADLDSQRPVSVTDLFEIGSITKSFVSLLANQLADEGVLSLDDPVTRWLPWVELGPETGAVRLRHLLAHTAGLVMGGEGMPDATAQAWTLRERAASGVGSHFHYSNLGYVLLGLVLTAATGTSPADLMQSRLFDPLGMPTALGRVTHADRARLATGHVSRFDDRPWNPATALTPAPWFEVAGTDGSVALAAQDLARYLRLFLADGVLDGQRVVSGEGMTRIASPAAPEGEDVLRPTGYPEVSDSRYGLGLNVERVGANDCLTHGGGMVGYASFVLADRTAGIGIGVLTNADGEWLSPQHLARVAHQVLLGVDAGRGLPALDELPRNDLGVPATALRQGLLGRFTGTSGDTLEVEPVDGQVHVRVGRTSARLWRTLWGRYVTDHPDLCRFALAPAAGDAGWVHGSNRFTSSAGGDPDPVGASDRVIAAHAALVGHYRSWTPWYTNFRIIAREGGLVLVAPGGVEAPTSDEELVEVSPRVWRIGADPWLPERLVEVARVDGRVQILDRDGARYSRTFTE